MSNSDIDKMFAEFPSPYLEEHDREVWRQQAKAYADSIEDWATKFFYYRWFDKLLWGVQLREILGKLQFADFSHALQSLKQIKKYKRCAKNFCKYSWRICFTNGVPTSIKY